MRAREGRGRRTADPAQLQPVLAALLFDPGIASPETARLEAPGAAVVRASLTFKARDGFTYRMVRDLRGFSQSLPGFPPVLFFYQGTVEEGQTFFGNYWPEARAISEAAGGCAQ